MKQFKGKWILSNAGFSLIGAMAAVSVISVVTLGGAYFASQTKTVEIKFDLQTDLDRSHLITLQKNRSVKNLKDQLNMSPALLNCLSKRGSNCSQSSSWPKSSFETVRQPQQPGSGGQQQQSCAGSKCPVETELAYRVLCASSTSCEAVEIQVTTRLPSSAQSSGKNFKPRISTLTIPGNLFADRAKIDFACASSNVVSGVDLKNLAAQCSTQVPNSSCSNQAPLKNYKKENPNADTVCPQLIASAPCSRGLASAGLFGGQTACR